MPLPEQDDIRLKRIDQLAHELIYDGYDFRRDRYKVTDMISLASYYGGMELRRRELMYWFEKYENYKRASKKEDAWRRVTGALHALSVATGHARAALGA